MKTFVFEVYALDNPEEMHIISVKGKNKLDALSILYQIYPLDKYRNIIKKKE